MRRITPLLVLALVLLLAGQATAKEVVSAILCGPADCRTVKDRRSLTMLHGGGPPAEPPAEASGYYEVRVTMAVGRGRHETSALVVLPGAGLAREGDAEQGYGWSPIPRATLLVYRRITRGLSPFPAAGLDGVAAPRAEPKRAGGDSSWPSLAAGGALVLLVAGVLAGARIVNGRWRHAAAPYGR